MNCFENKKIAILRGYPRLIDGESTSVEEMWKWSKNNKVKIETYYYHPEWKKKVPTYSDGYKHSYKIFNKNIINEIEKELNSYDLIILINFPKLHSGLKSNDVIEFYKLYLRLKPVKIQMQHTSFIKALNETPFLWSYINASDAIYNHSKNSYYINSIAKRLPSKKNRTYPMHLWLDTNQYNNYNFDNERKDTCLYIGRFVIYKGLKSLLNISEALDKENIKSIIYGMDTTIGCKVNILSHRNCNNLLQPNLARMDNPIVDTYGRVNHNNVFDLFYNSLFAWVPYKFKSPKEKTFYGNRLEYIMQEAICAGSILIVSKEWANECKTKDNIKYSDIPYFAILFDEDNPYETVKEMINIKNNLDLQKKYRKTAFNILKSEYDNNIVLPNLFNQLFSITKDNNKFETIFDLVNYLTENNDILTNKFCELYNQNQLLPMSPNSLNKNKLSVYGGKSKKKVEKIL